MGRLKFSELSPAYQRQAVAQHGNVFARGRQHKYRANRVTIDGVNYASRSEAARGYELTLQKKAKEIRDVRWQVRFTLGIPENVYIVDFVVTDNDGGEIAEDVKGYETPEFKRHKRLWRKYGPMPLHILKKRGGRWQTTVIEGGLSTEAAK